MTAISTSKKALVGALAASTALMTACAADPVSATKAESDKATAEAPQSAGKVTDLPQSEKAQESKADEKKPVAEMPKAQVKAEAKAEEKPEANPTKPTVEPTRTVIIKATHNDGLTQTRPSAKTPDTATTPSTTPTPNAKPSAPATPSTSANVTKPTPKEDGAANSGKQQPSTPNTKPENGKVEETPAPVQPEKGDEVKPGAGDEVKPEKPNTSTPDTNVGKDETPGSENTDSGNSDSNGADAANTGNGNSNGGEKPSTPENPGTDNTDQDSANTETEKEKLVRELTEKRDLAKAQLDQARQNKETIEARIASAESAHADAMKNVQSSYDSMVELRAQGEDKLSKLNAERRKAAEHSEKFGVLNERLANLKSALETLDGNLTEAEARVGMIQDEIERARDYGYVNWEFVDKGEREALTAALVVEKFNALRIQAGEQPLPVHKGNNVDAANWIAREYDPMNNGSLTSGNGLTSDGVMTTDSRGYVDAINTAEKNPAILAKQIYERVIANPEMVGYITGNRVNAISAAVDVTNPNGVVFWTQILEIESYNDASATENVVMYEPSSEHGNIGATDDVHYDGTPRADLANHLSAPTGFPVDVDKLPTVDGMPAPTRNEADLAAAKQMVEDSKLAVSNKEAAEALKSELEEAIASEVAAEVEANNSAEALEAEYNKLENETSEAVVAYDNAVSDGAKTQDAFDAVIAERNTVDESYATAEANLEKAQLELDQAQSN